MKRILAISLLFVFLAGQVNLTWATHICGKFAVESAVSFGKENLSCSTEEQSCCDEESEHHDGVVTVSEACCSNDFFSSDADDYFFKTDTEKKKLLQFAAAFVISYHHQNCQAAQKLTHNSTPDTLPIPPNRQVMYQTFLL